MKKYFPIGLAVGLLLLFLIPILAQPPLQSLVAKGGVTTSSISGITATSDVKVTFRDSKLVMDIQGGPRAELSVASVTQATGSIAFIATVVKSTVAGLNVGDSIQTVVNFSTLAITNTTVSPVTSASVGLTDLTLRR